VLCVICDLCDELDFAGSWMNPKMRVDTSLAALDLHKSAAKGLFHANSLMKIRLIIAQKKI
jgi:hypothetical protein